MTRASLQRSRWLFLVGIAASLILMIAAAIWILDQERRSDEAVSHTFQNERQLARILSLLQDAEVGQRGYILTGERSYLEPFGSANASLGADLDRLASGMADNSRQEANLAVLRSLVTQKLSELRQTIDRRQGGDASSALLLMQSGQGKQLMDGIRAVLAQMQAEEERLMTLRTAAARRSVLRIELTMLALVALCAGLAVTAFGSTLRRARSAEASRDALLTHFGRKLMAVLAADVTHYSRLMETDEAGTLERLMALRDRVDPVIATHGGRITSTAGDSLLAVFPSALAAVDCAVAMQTTNREAEAPPTIQLRIGINVGDIIEHRDDVFGDTVNIAARLEGLSDPGGICVSRAVRDHVGKQRRFTFEDIGFQTVKNITEPVSAFKVRF